MSFKYQAIYEGDCHYVLPRCAGMKAEGHAYLSPELYEMSEEALWSQLANSASYEGVIGAYLMPDTHSGYGVPIGGVIVTEDTIIQAGSGYDISCGVLYLEIPHLHAQDVASYETRQDWVREVEERIATGMGHGAKQALRLPEATARDTLFHGAKTLGVSKDDCERQFIPVPEDLDIKKIQKAYAKVASQLGSVGSGNHFVELQVDRDDGSVWAMIHCGSRGYGWQTANHYFYEGAKLRGISPKQRETSWLRADEPLGREYWDHHNTAANYAVANRHLLARGVMEATWAVFQRSARTYFEISHNLVQQETLVLPDGTTKTGFVHRKGATRAFPGGHPSLHGTKWEGTGHPCLIPGSMYDGAAVLFPLPGAYKTACSVNHGAGRVLGRGQAKRDFKERQAEINAEMQDVLRSFDGVPIQGIATNMEQIPLDECGHAYKDLDKVLDVLVQAKVARIERRLYPVANLKGVD